MKGKQRIFYKNSKSETKSEIINTITKTTCSIHVGLEHVYLNSRGNSYFH